MSTALNTEISLNFLVWQFCGNAQFPQGFAQFSQKSVDTVRFHKISTQEIRWNYGVLCSGTRDTGQWIKNSLQQYWIAALVFILKPIHSSQFPTKLLWAEQWNFSSQRTSTKVRKSNTIANSEKIRKSCYF